MNLAAAIAGRFGVEAAAPALDDPPVVEALRRATSVVSVLFDGLGERQLETHAPRGALAQCRVRSLDSVFPSSTAPAVTSFVAAASPATHGNPAWHVWSESAHAIIRSLPMDVRGDRTRTVRAGDTWTWRPWAERARVPAFAVLPREIAETEYSRHAYAGSTRLAYARIDEVPARVAEVLRACPGGASVFVYLPQFDAISHEAGWASDAAAAVAGGFDRWFASLLERVAGFDALVLGTADHGFVDVEPRDQFRLEAFAAIAACLEHPLCGEPRVPFCQVLPQRRERFAEIVAAELGDAFAVHPSAELLDAGWFGVLPAHGRGAALAGRIGTHVLVPKRRVTMVDAVEGEPSLNFVGMHGGPSDEEMRVPLLAAWRGAALG